MKTPRTLFAWLVAVGMVLLPISVASASSRPAAAHPAASLGKIVIGDEGFTESQIVQYIYGELLANLGYQVSYQTTGSRAIALPALEKGSIDLLPDYAGSLLVYLAPKDTKQAGVLTTAISTLNTILAKNDAAALPATAGLDQNVFVVTKATQQKYHLTTLSSLTSHASGWTFGAPPECSTYYFCAPGLKAIYGIKFKVVKSFDESGPLTVLALQKGTAQVVELFSTDSVITQDGFYQLQDNLNLEPADHILPIIRKSFDTPAVQKALASVNADLTTAELTKLDGEPGSGSHPSVQSVVSSFLKAEKLG